MYPRVGRKALRGKVVTRAEKNVAATPRIRNQHARFGNKQQDTLWSANGPDWIEFTASSAETCALMHWYCGRAIVLLDAAFATVCPAPPTVVTCETEERRV